jgi:hypothetical protein
MLRNIFSCNRRAGTTLLLAASVVAAALAAAPALADIEPDVSWYTANPEADVFYLDDAADLLGLHGLMDKNEVSELTNGEENNAVHFENKTIVLRENIDLTGIEWVPMGKYGAAVISPSADNGVSGSPTPEYQPFEGTFDGGGNRVKYSPHDTGERGFNTASFFFAVGADGAVRDLSLEMTAPSFDEGGDVSYLGGVSAVNIGHIEDCDVTLTNVSNLSYQYAGGIATVNLGVIERCSAQGDIVFTSATESYAGGIAGYNTPLVMVGTGGIIRGSSFTGKIFVEFPGAAKNPNVGGIAGISKAISQAIEGKYPPSIIENCRVNASLQAKTTDNNGYGTGYVGGIAGAFSMTNYITDCSFNGSLAGGYVGGIVGGMGNTSGGNLTLPGLISGCAAEFSLIGEAMSVFSSVNAGGIAGSLPQALDIENCFASADMRVDNFTITSDVYSAVYIGGIIGTNMYTTPAVNIKNCVSSGFITTGNRSGNKFYALLGGIAAYLYNNPGTIQNCVSMSNVVPLQENLTYGFKNNGLLIAYALSTNPAAMITNSLAYVPADSTNTMKLVDYATGNVSDTIGTFSDISNIVPAAAIMTPPYGTLRLSGEPLGLTVKLYPEGANTNGVTGSWSADNPLDPEDPERLTVLEVIEVTGDGLSASVSAKAAGTAKAVFTAAEGLFGDYAASVSSLVTALPAFDSNTDIERIWTTYDGKEYEANGDGVFLFPKGTGRTNLDALPIHITLKSPKASVSSDKAEEAGKGETYDFSSGEGQVFTVTAEDGTKKQYTVSALIEQEALSDGIASDAEKTAGWKGEAEVLKDGRVSVTLRIPLRSDFEPDWIREITAETEGFEKASVTFLIISSSGDIVFRRSASPGGPRYAAEGDYTLVFNGICASEADYQKASIKSITYKDEYGESYTQKLGGADGVTLFTETGITFTSYDDSEDDSEDDDTPQPASGGGGCDTGAPAALAAAALALVPRGKKRGGR